MFFMWIIAGLFGGAGVAASTSTVSPARGEAGESVSWWESITNFFSEQFAALTGREEEPSSVSRGSTRRSRRNYTNEDTGTEAAGNMTLISHLHPAIREEAAAMVAELAEMGIPVRVTETVRSIGRQEALYAQGRTTSGPRVTQARGGQSFHNYALAFDIVPLEVINRHNWDPENPVWDTLGEVGRRYGFEWGGDFRSFTDRPHFQAAGISTAMLRRLTRSGDVDRNGFVDLPAAVEARYDDITTPGSRLANAIDRQWSV